MNVNMLDDEVAKKNTENKKKKFDYKPYDEAEEDEYGTVSLLFIITVRLGYLI